MAIEVPPGSSGGADSKQPDRNAGDPHEGNSSRGARRVTPFRRLRNWLAERLSIRQRLTLWYATLLIALLTLLSAVTFTVAENQIQTNLNSDIRTRAIAIAGALQHEQYSSDGGSSVLPPGSATGTVVVPTPSATAQATPSSTASSTPTGGASETPTANPTPQTTPDPATNAAIQKQLTVTVPDVLGRLDLGFEVLDSGGRLKYLAPSLNGHSLPVNYAVVNDALRGVAGSYSARVDGALLAIYVQPIVITPHTSGRSPGAGATATPTPANDHAPTVSQQVAGVVLVAKSEEDVKNALSTLGRILLIGDLVAIFCALLGGWLIAESSLRPITTITRAAKAIARDASAAGLGTRVRYRGAKDEVGELVSTFNEMLASLEQVADAQRRFVSDASHELRAPLTTIRGNLELLRQRPHLSAEDRAEIIDDAYLESERMATLVSDLLMLARVDAASASRGARATLLDEQLSGRRELVEMDQLAMELYRSGQSHLRALRKHINLSVTEIAPVSVMADPGQARQLGMILLDNAIKYTPRDGSIHIAVAQLGPFATLTVSDTGIGISAEDFPHIFERFYRADRARERDEHGSGLGLAIAKWIAEAHHGEIKVESAPGRGSVFTVLLPAARRVGDQTLPKVATGRRKRVRKNTLSLAAIKPLARLAQSVSRPVRSSAARSTRANGASDARGARGAAKSSGNGDLRSSGPTSAVSPNARSGRRPGPPGQPPRRD